MGYPNDKDEPRETKGHKMTAPRRILSRCAAPLRRLSFSGSAPYWDRRYLRGGDSGAGSSGELAHYKARFVNSVIGEFGAETIIEWGCGDGQQLALAEYPRYVGLDVSAAAIRRCLQRFPQDKTKSFLAYDPSLLWDGAGFLRSDAALSLDVIYHLVEDSAFETYMTNLFLSAERLVVIYSSDLAVASLAPHIRYRRFSEWIAVHATEWCLVKTEINPYSTTHAEDTSRTMASFFVYVKGATTHE